MEVPWVGLVAVPSQHGTHLLARDRMENTDRDIEHAVVFAPTTHIDNLTAIDIAHVARTDEAFGIGIVSHESGRHSRIPVAAVQSGTAEEDHTVKRAHRTQSLTVLQHLESRPRRRDVDHYAAARVVAVDARRTYVTVFLLVRVVFVHLASVDALFEFADPAFVLVCAAGFARLHETAVAVHAEVVVVSAPEEFPAIRPHAPGIRAVAFQLSAHLLCEYHLFVREAVWLIVVLYVAYAEILFIDGSLIEGVDGVVAGVVHLRPHAVLHLIDIERIDLVYYFRYLRHVDASYLQQYLYQLPDDLLVRRGISRCQSVGLFEGCSALHSIQLWNGGSEETREEAAVAFLAHRA